MRRGVERLSPSPDRHDQGIGDELRRHVGAHRPADHVAGEQIDDRRNIEPALCRPYVGEVGDPLAIGGWRFEASVEHVGSGHARRPFTPVGRQTPPSRSCPQGLLAHQPFNPVQSARHAVRQHVVPHAPCSVGSVARNEACPHLGGQLFIAPATLAARSHEPGIKATQRDPERPAQPFRRPDPPVLRDEAEPHVDSFAK